MPIWSPVLFLYHLITSGQSFCSIGGQKKPSKAIFSTLTSDFHSINCLSYLTICSFYDIAARILLIAVNLCLRDLNPSMSSWAFGSSGHTVTSHHNHSGPWGNLSALSCQGGISLTELTILLYKTRKRSALIGSHLVIFVENTTIYYSQVLISNYSTKLSCT